MPLTSKELAAKRAKRIRFRLRKSATLELRLSVHRTNKNIYAQIIDDSKGCTLVAASSHDEEVGRSNSSSLTVDISQKVGEVLAKRAKAAKVERVYFDRGSYLYHGRIKALAEGARAGGLQF